jgi:hypothetical protein
MTINFELFRNVFILLDLITCNLPLSSYYSQSTLRTQKHTRGNLNWLPLVYYNKCGIFTNGNRTLGIRNIFLDQHYRLGNNGAERKNTTMQCERSYTSHRVDYYLEGQTSCITSSNPACLRNIYMRTKLPFWNLNLLYLIALIQFWEEYKWWRSSLWIFPPFGYFFFKYCPQASVHTYFISYYHIHIKLHVKIIVLCTSIFRLLICYVGPKIYELCHIWKALLAIFILYYCRALWC